MNTSLSNESTKDGHPVTTGPDFFTDLLADDHSLWTAGFLNERFPAPVSPLGWSIVRELLEEIAFRDPLRFMGFDRFDTLPITRLYHGHPYVNVEVFEILYRPFPEALLPEDAWRYFPYGDTSLRRQAPYPRSILSPRFLLSVLRAFARDPANWSPLHNQAHWQHYVKRHEQEMKRLSDRLAVWQETNQLAPVEVFQALQVAQNYNRELLRLHRWSLTHADLCYTALCKLVAAWVEPERPGELCSWLVAGAENKSLEVNRALHDLAALASRSPRLRQVITQPAPWVEMAAALREDEEGSAFLAALQVFLQRYGHRSFSLDILHPTFADDPALVVGLIRVLLARESEPGSDGELGEEGCGARQRVQVALSRSWLDRLLPVRRLLFQAVLALARRYLPLREDQRFYWQQSLAVMRKLFLLLGEKMSSQGILAESGDVFFLTQEEIRGCFVSIPQRDDPKRLVASRKAAFRCWWSAYQADPAGSYPPFLRGNRPLEEGEREEAKVFHGQPVSAGLARGRVRVVSEPEQLGTVGPGDILVVPSTDPAWTPVFAIVGGLIMERGGQLSHGAVVAREVGLPAVTGIPHITHRLRDGQTVIVDGTTGTVTVL